MSQFAARDQANTLAASPHPEAEQSSAPFTVLPGSNPQKPKMSAANFRLLTQRLGGKQRQARPNGATRSQPHALTSGPTHLSLLVEPPIAEETPAAVAVIAADIGPAAPEPASPPPDAPIEASEPPPFDLMSLKEESHAPLALTLSPLDRDPAVIGLMAVPEEISPAYAASVPPEPITMEPEAFEFPEHPHEPDETPVQDLASLIGNASLREMEPLEEESGLTAPSVKNVRLILEPAVPARDEFATAELGEAFAVPKSAAPAPEQPQPLADTAPAGDDRPTGYRFWESGNDAAEVRRRVLSRPFEEPSEEAGEVARTLIEIMSLPTKDTQPQERALAADTLLHLIPRIPARSLVAMAERLTIMEAPPPLVLAQLIHDRRIEIAGPLLERCSAIADHDLVEVMTDGNEQSIRMIARRRHLSPILCDALIATGDSSALLTLVRNPGALLTHEAFHRLNELAREHPSLQAPLATRADLPAPVAFELFWALPAELRRYVISRFLTDSSTLGKILKLTMRIDAETESPVGARFSTPEETDRLVAAMASGNMPEAERILAEALGLNLQTASKIVADAHGEPLCVALKALGVTRARFEEIVGAAKTGAMRASQRLAELQGFFESLSFNKARVLLTYWDWGVLGTGPYAAISV
jgi:uncharacterized protein (DUF2336 family)